MITNSNLFERFAIIGGADAYLYDVKTKALESVFENCNSLELATKGDKIDITEKGAIVMSVPKPSTTSLKFTAETTTFSKLALALGSAGFELTTEADTYTKDEVFEVTDTASMIFNLSTEATSVDDINAFLITEDGELVKALAITLGVDKKAVTVTTDADIAVGDKIRFNYTTSIALGKMYQFKVPEKANAGAKKIIIDCVGVNKVDGSKQLFQIEIYKVNTTNGVTITFDDTKASSFDLEFNVLSSSENATDEEGSQFFRYKVLAD